MSIDDVLTLLLLVIAAVELGIHIGGRMKIAAPAQCEDGHFSRQKRVSELANPRQRVPSASILCESRPHFNKPQGLK